MSKNPGWFEILEAAKKLGDDFTGSSLGAAVGLIGTKESSPTQIASAWLLKFEKWGYVQRTGTVPSGGPRPSVTWVVTKKGQECRLQESLESRFARLLSAVKGYQESIGKGQAGETTAWKKLCKIAGEVDLAG